MPNFILAEGGYIFRPLKHIEPRQKGWDVWALQTAILDSYAECDGIFGERTQRAVLEFQRSHKLEADGIAGPSTQKAVCQSYITPLRKEYGIPKGLLNGQVRQESAFLVGNYTLPYPDGSRDCGPCQRNTNYTPMEQGFNVPLSLTALAKQVSNNYVRYYDLGVVGERRCWDLAAGSWNAPSWTDRLAEGGTISAFALAHITEYIARVTKLVEWS